MISNKKTIGIIVLENNMDLHTNQKVAIKHHVYIFNYI